MARARVLGWAATAALAAGVVSSAAARPQYLQAFKAHYTNAGGKPTLAASNCSLCHVGPPPQARWNPYGEALRAALGARNVTDPARITAALEKAGAEKSPSGATFAALIAQDRMPGAAAPASPAGEWIAVFNGVNMDGWTKMNAGDWKVEDFRLKYTGGGNGWLRTNRQFRNYALTVVWRYTEDSPANDSGIFLRAGLEGNPWPNSPQLNMGPGDNLGSIGGTQGTRARPDLIRKNDWNVYSVAVTNGRATLAINGQIAWDVATGIPDRPGYLGIQAENRPFEIAGFWVMELP